MTWLIPLDRRRHTSGLSTHEADPFRVEGRPGSAGTHVPEAPGKKKPPAQDIGIIKRSAHNIEYAVKEQLLGIWSTACSQ